MSEVTMPSYQEFLDNLYSLNPMNDPEQMYEILKDFIGIKLPTNNVLTFELLIEKYRNYLTYLKPYNDVKDKKYIKKDKEIFSIGMFLISKLYINDYSSLINDPSDKYLFGIN